MDRLFVRTNLSIQILSILLGMLLFGYRVGFSQNDKPTSQYGMFSGENEKKPTSEYGSFSKEGEELFNVIAQKPRLIEATVKTMIRIDVRGNIFSFITRLAENREYIGINEAQWETCRDNYNKLEDVLIEGLVQYKNLAESEDIEEQEKFGAIMTETYESLVSKAQDEFVSQLSREQLVRLKELELVSPLFALFGAGKTMNYSGYDFLELSEIQKEQFEEMKNEFAEANEDAIHKFIALTRTEGADEKDMAELSKAFEKFAEISKNHKERIDRILTESQKAKLAATKEKVAETLKKIKEKLTEKENENSKYVPDKNSWKPGDLVPEQPKKEKRPSLFPII